MIGGMPLDEKPPVLKRVVPSGTRAGQGFNVQPNGQAALCVDCENALPSTAIVWCETSLPTAFGNSHALSALVPAALYARPARVKLYLKDRLTGLQSNVEQFTVSR